MQSMAERLFRAIGREDMITDPRFAKNENRVANRSEVDEVVGQWFASRSRDEVMHIMTEAGVTVAPLYDISDIADDVHFVERGIYKQVPDEELGQAAIHAPVPRLSKTPASLRSAAPALGQHTNAVLAEAGFEAEAIDSLRAKGVVA
jgi:crotonobetainyl-CoA:carnitine CoA-transferase CaiB-like acyl-CoA transferase